MVCSTSRLTNFNLARAVASTPLGCGMKLLRRSDRGEKACDLCSIRHLKDSAKIFVHGSSCNVTLMTFALTLQKRCNTGARWATSWLSSAASACALKHSASTSRRTECSHEIDGENDIWLWDLKGLLAWTFLYPVRRRGDREGAVNRADIRARCSLFAFKKQNKNDNNWSPLFTSASKVPAQSEQPAGRLAFRSFKFHWKKCNYYLTVDPFQLINWQMMIRAGPTRKLSQSHAKLR